MKSTNNSCLYFFRKYFYCTVALLLMIGMITSCQKDDESAIAPPNEIELPEPCTEIPSFSGLGLRPAIVDSAYYTRPVVNPNNPDEIIFLNNKDYKVYKLNYITGEQNVVLEDAMSFSDADWGVNDWILFTQFQNLYKVKSNGDSLIQITYNGIGRYGVWNPGGDKYIYTTSTTLGNGLMTVISNSSDVIIDTLPVIIQTFRDWHTDSIISWALGYFKLGEDTVGRILDFGIAYSVAGVSEHESIHLSSEGGMKHLNILTGSVTQLQPPYPNCHYYVSGIHYSSQKKKLLAQSVYKELLLDGVHEYLRHDIVWLNLDGTLHDVIDIAQFMDP